MAKGSAISDKITCLGSVVISDITDKVDVAENGINWIILSY
jgi:hypothetical protein